jgi:hypothetical protein
MNDGSTSSLRRQFAALFLLCVLLAGPVLMLLWGRVGGSPEFAAAADSPPDGLLVPGGRKWEARLTADDASYLIGLFMDCLAGHSETASPAPAACKEPWAAPLFVTVYGIEGAPVCVLALEASPADAVREAARETVVRLGGAPDADALRVRLDVLRRAQPFGADERVTFACREFGAPVGLALRGDSAHFVLPADAAPWGLNTHEAMLRAVCLEAGLAPDAWRQAEVDLYRLEGEAFVNDAVGSRYALPCPRGLTPVGEPTLARLLRASRLAADYLLRAQHERGAFLAYWDPVGGLPGGCESVADQAAAAAGLAVLCELRERPDAVAACYDAASYLMQHTDRDPQEPTRAFTRRQEACRLVWETEASAHVLEALCRYRRVARRSEPDAWIAALADFLLFMQRDDGLFELQYDAETGRAHTPHGRACGAGAQAQAALGLALAYREVERAEYVAGCSRALDALMAADDGAGHYGAEEARRLMAALREECALAPHQDRRPWAARIAASRRTAQLTPEAAPAADLVGGTLERLPPAAGETADDLVVFAAACMMQVDEAANREAARQAAGYLMRLQYLPENAYYLAEAEGPLGGFREAPGSHVIRLRTVEAALRGLTTLARLELATRNEDD